MAILTTSIMGIVGKALLGAAAGAGANWVIQNTDWKDFFEKAGKGLKNLGEISKGYKDWKTDKVLPGEAKEQIAKSGETTTPQNNAPNTNIPGETEQPLQGIPGIQDKTEDNIETPIGNSSTLDEWKKILEDERKWREEQQKHIEEREDTAVQRWVADARKAGVNINLLNSIGSASSTGLSSEMVNTSNAELLKQIETYSQEMQQLIELNWSGDEKSLDRFTSIFEAILQIGSMALFMRKGK